MEFAVESRVLLDMIHAGKIIALVSDLINLEISRAPISVRNEFDLLPKECIEPLLSSSESEMLRDKYLTAGIIGPKQKNDAHHVAIATIAHADLIVSWNFKHLVHWEKIRGFNSVNLREGYNPIDIRSPREVI